MSDQEADDNFEEDNDFINNDNSNSQRTTFQDLGVNQWLIDSLKAMSIKYPSEIQKHCIPPILSGRNCIGGAKTGSGKTIAFALPILQKLSEDPYADQFKVLGKSINLKSSVIVGGLDMMNQAIELSRKPHIVIATPGRLVGHINNSGVKSNLARIKFLVLDEADFLLTDTFTKDLKIIFDSIPETRQTLLFTATMTENILELKNSPKNPFIYQVKSSISTVSKLLQYYIFIPSHVKEPYLIYLLRSKINDELLSNKSVIIFCNRCRTAEMLRVMLIELGLRCTSLHSTMSQQERLNSLGKFKAEVIKILISTDVDPTDYIHRVGRTARAGRGGLAISIMTEHDIKSIHNIENRINKKLEEWEINENKVIETLNEQLHDTKFGEIKEIQKKKREIENGSYDDNKINNKKVKKVNKSKEVNK
ncbi:14373_t:CDS:2 [Entrophospora sp. SA101]|nr:14373_t:CDS:2 [Entrophospora sp. SA101]CAJ0871860.1 8219_t:CDS:2 [Entrophospora sp. SA101]